MLVPRILAYQFGYLWVIAVSDADAELFKCYPHLSAADLANAWAYAEAHPEEIEAAIARNEEP